MMLKRFIGTKEFYKRVAMITLPILVQQIITNFVNLVDNIMVGQVGAEEMTGVAIVNQLLFVFNICIFGGVSGPGIFTAQYHGKGDTKGVRDTFRVKIIVVLTITVISFVILTAFDSPLISAFLTQSSQGAEEISIDKAHGFATEYLQIMLIQLPLFAITQAYSGTLRETGNTVLPMIGSIIAVGSNVFLDWVLIFGKFGLPALGVKGAAIATVLARLFESVLVISITHIKSGKNKFIKGAYRSFKIPHELMGDIIRKGFPLMLNEVLWSIGTTMLTQCYSECGVEAVSAYSISSTVSNMFFCAYFAFGSAISIIVGQHLGAGDIKRAKDEAGKMIFASVMVCVIIGGMMALFAPLFPQIYKTTDTVKSLATSFLLVSSAFMPISGFVHNAYFTLRSGGKTFITFLFDSGFVWAFALPVAFVLSRFTAIPVIYMFLIVHSLEIIKAIGGFILVKKGVWLNNLVAE